MWLGHWLCWDSRPEGELSRTKARRSNHSKCRYRDVV